MTNLKSLVICAIAGFSLGRCLQSTTAYRNPEEERIVFPEQVITVIREPVDGGSNLNVTTSDINEIVSNSVHFVLMYNPQ